MSARWFLSFDLRGQGWARDEGGALTLRPEAALEVALGMDL